MNCNNLFDRDGYVKLPPKVGDGVYKPIRKGESPVEIEFCMNCKKKNCKNGTCRRLVRMKRKMKEETKNA